MKFCDSKHHADETASLQFSMHRIYCFFRNVIIMIISYKPEGCIMRSYDVSINPEICASCVIGLHYTFINQHGCVQTFYPNASVDIIIYPF